MAAGDRSELDRITNMSTALKPITESKSLMNRLEHIDIQTSLASNDAIFDFPNSKMSVA